MVNIYDIIQSLVPEYKITKKSSKRQHLVIKDIEKSKFTNFEPHGTFTNLFSCLLFQHGCTLEENKDCFPLRQPKDTLEENTGQYQTINEILYNFELDKLKEYMDSYEFNPLINIKKMSSLVTQNIVNNELILFLSGYFASNIYIYSFESKLLKIYYLEEQLDPNKKSIIIVNKKDLLSPNVGFQTFDKKVMLTHTSPLVLNLCESIYIIGIGLKENKVLEFGSPGSSTINPVKFVLGPALKIDNTITVDIDDNIFIDTGNFLEDDKDSNKYDLLEFNINIEEIYRKYSKDKLMKCICKYYKK
jgi:hypothetical protein